MSFLLLRLSHSNMSAARLPEAWPKCRTNHEPDSRKTLKWCLIPCRTKPSNHTDDHSVPLFMLPLRLAYPFAHRHVPTLPSNAIHYPLQLSVCATLSKKPSWSLSQVGAFFLASVTPRVFTLSCVHCTLY